MPGLVSRVAATVARRRMFHAGERVGVAVSGGADSVCLLHVLRELECGLSLMVLHVNHGLRGAESDADEAFVRDLAARLGLEFRCYAADVRSISQSTRDNLEQAARRVRHEFFAGLRRDKVVEAVALGHTRSDQAETVLFRILRGAGTAGLSGIRPVTREGLVRPLIDVNRGEVRDFLAERGIAWREDASNLDPAFARNRIRHELLPALARDFNPAIEDTLAGMAEVAQDEERYWETFIGEQTVGRLVTKPPVALFRAGLLADLEPAVARRAARRVIEAAKGDMRGIDLAHIEQVLSVARAQTSAARVQIPGLDVFRSYEWVRLAPLGFDRLEDRNYRAQAPVPGRVAVPGTTWSLELQLQSDSSYNGSDDKLDWGRIAGKLELRNWRPGDQYRPVGHACEAKIKSMFQAARVPLWDRRKWPILTSGETILWAAHFGPSADWAATERTRICLSVRVLGDILEFCNPSDASRRPIGKDAASVVQAGEIYEF
jgi:tRNA(Ile)-lysidine synthase